MVKVIIDAGHGGTDRGAVYKDRLEKDDNLRLALAVGEILADYGVDVSYTRTGDIYHSPNERVRMINQEGGDLLVSLHRNTSPNPNMYSGVESFVYRRAGIQHEVGMNIHERLEEVGFYDLGIHPRTDLAILRGAQMPTIMLEVGFINSDVDNETFDDRFDEIANAIASGIIQTFGIEAEEPIRYRYRVQVGLFRIYENALNLMNLLLMQGHPAQIITQGEFYAVQVGDYEVLDEAAAIERMLREMGHNTLIVAV